MKFSRLLLFFLASLLIGILIFQLFHSGRLVFAQKQDCSKFGDPQANTYCYEINKLWDEYENLKKAMSGVEASLSELEKRIDSLQKGINQAEVKQKQLEKDIFEREVELGYQKEVLALRVRHYYIKSRQYSPLLLFLSSESAIKLTRELVYRQMATDDDKEVIISISQDLKKLKEDSEQLEKTKVSLAKLQADLNKQAEPLRKDLAGAKAYEVALSQKIAELTAKQQALLAEKTGTFQTTVGEVPLADDPSARPDFDPGFRPAFAAFSFGAPHRKGMSQYGAWGRAKSEQDAETILRAYYGGVEIKKDYSTSINITVQGYGTVDIETYVKRIYEMPGTWTDNNSAALKAQTVAARSYALAYTNNGQGSICATESCQVYKPANKGGAWEAAVEATRGWVMMANGKPLSAWYAASSGGYNYQYTTNGFTTAGGWDTKCGNQSCWTNDAYEKIAGSPWFYKGWYKSRSGATCGRSHPWLNQEEMADILNAVIAYRFGQSSERILPIDYVSCFGKSGDPFSFDQLRQIGGISSVSGVEVSYGTNGQTNKLVFKTNKSDFEVGGEEFYTVFNLRAPARISLKSKLFNIEKK